MALRQTIFWFTNYLIIQPPDFNIPEPGTFSMILQYNVAASFRGKSRDVLKLAVINQRIELWRVSIVFKDFGSVQPVFPMVSPEDDTAGVKFTGRLKDFFPGRRHQIV
jgi:hypothetical protein